MIDVEKAKASLAVKDACGMIAQVLVGYGRSHDQWTGDLPGALYEVMAEYGVNAASPFFTFTQMSFVCGFEGIKLPPFLAAYTDGWYAGKAVRDIAEDLAEDAP